MALGSGDGEDRSEATQALVRAVLEFRALYEVHRAVGRVEPLEAYQARFPGHEAAVASELARLSADGVLVDAPSSMDDVVRRLATEGQERYRTVEQLGRGGMGIVYRVRDEDLRRDLAMKVIPGEEGRLRPADGGDATLREPGAVLRRFLQEAQVTAQLDHPGIVPVHELGVDADGYAFFTMKYVRGRTLADVIRLLGLGREGWTLSRAVQMLLRICETVAFAHDRGVIHRDLKPANIMVGEFGQVYVMDWGLAKVRRAPGTAPPAEGGDVARESAPEPATSTPAADDTAAATRVGSIIGTAHYMPPEQAAGRVADLDARSDIYALGAILYEVLCGLPPYGVKGGAPSADEVVRAVLSGPPAPLHRVAPEVPPELAAVCERAMHRDPARRYASAGDLADDLHRFLDGRVVRAYRGGPVAELRKWVARNRAVAATGSAIVLLLVAGATAFAVQERRAAARILGERNAAVAARDRADAATRRADGLRLAAQSLVLADEDPTLALLLAMEAGRAAPGLDSSTALYRALGLQRELRRLSGHDDYIDGAAFSPDGSRVVTWDTGVLACLWDAASGALLHRLDEHEGRIAEAEFSADGRLLATASQDGTARVWDVASGRRVAILGGHGAGVRDVAFDPSGARIATACTDGLARVFEAATGREAARFGGHGAEVRSVEFSPDGSRVLSAGGDQTARLWDAGSGTQILSAVMSEDPDPFVAGLAPDRERALGPRDGARFVGDGSRFVTDSSNGRVRFFDASDGRLLADPAEEPPRSRLGGVSATGDAVVVRRWIPARDGGRGGHAAVVRDPMGRRPDAVVDTPFSVAWAAVTRGGRRVLLGPRSFDAYLHDGRTGALEARLVGHFYSVIQGAFSPDGTRAVTSSTDMTVRVWDADPEHRYRVAWPAADGGFEEPLDLDRDAARAVRFAPDAASPRRAVEIVGARTGEVLHRLDDPGMEVHRAAFAPDGTSVALAGETEVAVWRPADGAIAFRRGGFDRPNPFFRPDGRVLALRQRDRVVLLDAADGSPLPPGEPLDIEGALLLSFDPSGTRFVSPDGGAGTVTVRDAATGAVVQRFAGHTGWVLHAAFDPTGTRVASSAVDRSVRIWDVATGRMLGMVRGVPMEGHALGFGPDGSGLVACARRQLRILGTEGPEVLAVVDATEDAGFLRAWYAPDGASILVQGHDHSIRRLPVDPLAAARARAPRELDPEERDRHGIGTPEERRAYRRLHVLRQGRMRDLLSLGLGSLREGDFAGAAEAFEAADRARPRMPHGRMGFASAAAWRSAGLPGGSPERAAAVDEAFRQLEAALERGWSEAGGLDGNGFLDPIRGDPRYVPLAERALRKR